jgi:hypothetical protein
MFIFTGYIIADQDISNARDYKNQVVSQIEESNLSENVINTCKTKALEHGYILDTNIIKNEDNLPVIVEISLKYNYTIKFLNILKEHVLYDMAR